MLTLTFAVGVGVVLGTVDGVGVNVGGSKVGGGSSVAVAVGWGVTVARITLRFASRMYVGSATGAAP